MRQQIALRCTQGWYTYLNTGKHHCDICRQRLWVNPGGGLYCDKDHGDIHAEIEKGRALWATVARDNGWYSEPFHVLVWLAPDGSIDDSLYLRGGDKDIIAPALSDSEETNMEDEFYAYLKDESGLQLSEEECRRVAVELEGVYYNQQ